MTLESLEKLQESFKNGITRSLAFRKSQLLALYKMLDENEKEICEALFQDIHKSAYEAKFGEILLTKQELCQLIKNMDSWLAEEKVAKSFLTIFDSTWIQRQPYGVALCIGAWNYPINITINPLAGLLAAGNCVILKPSEISVHTGKLLFELIPKYLDENVCRVELGDSTRMTEILKERFDYIVYTGSSSVGKIIMEAAAKHLTPVTLECGGKSPTFVDKHVNLKMAAKRIIWGKYFNAGQTCVAPDYLLCHKDVKDEFIRVAEETIEEFFSSDASLVDDFARIVNKRHFDRVMDLIKETKGKIILGGTGKEDTYYVAPTIVIVDSVNDKLMKDEIFGPILPILPVDSEDEAIKIINKGEKPLSLYVFSNRPEVMKRFEKETTSGSIVFNDVIVQHLVSKFPFGGVGLSGIGRYKGIFSINEFSHRRAVMKKDTGELFNNLMRYPPYNKKKEGWLDWAFKSNPTSRTCTII